MVIAGMALVGWGAGCCQMAAFALPELLPNKWRHIGVVIAGKLKHFDAIPPKSPRHMEPSSGNC